MSTALIVRDDSRLDVAFTQAAIDQKTHALEVAALVGRVSNPDEQEAAVNAQKYLADILSQVEKARKFAKEPILEFGRKLDGAAKTFISELLEENSRIAKAIGDFQALELAKVRAAQAAENERLNKLERERMAEAAKAQTHEQLEAVHEKFNERAREESVAIAPARVQGQMVSESWDYQVRDVWAFVRWAMSSGNTDAVTVEPKRSEIKALLKAGVQIPGIKGWPTVNASVRAGHQQKAISV